ncbi:Outer membrane protein beta-barrel domain-containing protein [Zobellia uliginosa]|uniref:Outer membrane protein beta-barrel domain-containing protein n=1 Tax=Zobellia uliginosa TaxID=143224 RepID=A0ABY1L031_9FLAO|nr:porin family protein [Zobellia uliginosa]MDO6519923.1 porin family protein [Zobellia uliginosa]SIS90415.1 Outer membrane protein beta-barrel domain-containing protein [Zobellia uliginosa]
MRRTLLTAVFALVSIAAFSQKDLVEIGVKAGLNYSANGDYFESIGDAARDPDRNMGYHLGLFGKIGISRIYFRPELMYTKTKSDYNGDKFDISKLDMPLLVGIKVVGPLHVFAGPSFQYILDTEFDGISIDDIENDFSVGANIGAGVDLGKLGIDIRYERGFNSNEATFINTNITELGPSRVDARPDQLIVSLSLTL